MQLHAAIVPPPSVVEAALEAARVIVSPPAPSAPEQKARLLDRVLGRREPEAPAPPELTFTEAAPGAAHVRLAKFGNVTSTDAGSLADALAAAAGGWPVPVVYVTHLVVGKAYPFEVSARLEGDLDALRGLHRHVNEVAQSQGFFLDRRSFRSELVLGAVQTAEYDSSVPLAGIEVPCRGPYWSPTHVTLLRSSWAAGATTFTEYERIDLAGDPALP
ncbi:hypothetical protein Q9S36_22460 [Microbacterium sp. ARD31]|uniref:hypothetical protein n=1 Tax=Microbacterium sp. ARD31 TaxID=2962576 RepID=UPI00288143CC|nr:hypothetical protein [Microbacterium sp. ARD31]MDT0182946.1 hypothetical protein [Microbacterium sp. ARD31]